MEDDDNTSNAAAPIPRIIPSSYWKEKLGFSKEYAESMEYLQMGLISTNVHDYRYFWRRQNGGFRLIIDPKNFKLRKRISNRDDKRDKDNNTIIWYHDLLFPHWKCFIQHLSTAPCIYSLSIVNIQLSTEILDLLLTTFATKRNSSGYSESLTLSCNLLGRRDISLVVAYLKKNPSLKTLNLNGNKITDVTAKSSLLDAVQKHRNLSHLFLKGCGLGDDANAVSKLLSNDYLSTLDLSDNQIGSQCAAVISNHLKSHNGPKINTLCLNGNIMNDNDALQIANALKNNCRLQYLSMAGNNLSHLGENELCRAIFDTSSIKSLIHSNHTCSLWLGGRFPLLEKKIDRINRFLPQSTRHQQKFLLALVSSDIDVPIHIMPHVLEWLQKEPEDEANYKKWRYKHLNELSPLTRTFQVLRNWKMPSLYNLS